MSWMRWALATTLVVHAVALYLPGSAISGPSSLPPGSDKVVHFLLFAAPAFLIRRITSRWWPIGLLALHAPVSEVIQWGLVPHRSGDPFDVVADLLGIIAGVWLAGQVGRGTST